LKFSQNEKRFLKYFSASFVFFYAILKILPLQPLNLFIAFAQEKILFSVGYSVFRIGTTLLVGRAAFEIVMECSGLLMMALFFSLLYATKIRIPRARLLGYFAFFFIFNLFRLAFTLAVGANYGQNALNIAHPALWFVDSAVVFACWAKEYGFKLPRAKNSFKRPGKR
jgi:exosortase/archaeosortase family protein